MRMLLKYLIVSLLFSFLSCAGFAARDIVADSIPCNTNAAPEAKAVLKYLAYLSSGKFKGAICGQNCEHGIQISGSDPANGFSNLVVGLYKKTGKWAGMIGVDYEYGKCFTPGELSECNKVLIAYWKKGGLITINMSPLNPWVYDESAINSGYSWNGTRILDKVDLKQLLDPASAVYKNWRKKLDRLAGALKELKKAGVVVLWRPMQEMNGHWFWWGAASHPDNPAPFIDLYRDMYNYFTYIKGLNNLLWVYSPNAGGNILKFRIKAVNWAYPGDNYVDVVAGTSYNNSLDIADYKAYVSMKKPMGMGEFGPDPYSPESLKGVFDNRKYIERIRKDYPGISYWVCWHDWTENGNRSIHLSLNANTRAAELMNDPDIITLDKLNWRVTNH